MGKDITFNDKTTVKKSMEFYKGYFRKMGNAYATKQKIQDELNSKPMTGKDKKELKHSVNRLKNFATDYGLDPNLIDCRK